MKQINYRFGIYIVKRLFPGISRNMNSIAFGTDILIRENGDTLRECRFANINTINLSTCVTRI